MLKRVAVFMNYPSHYTDSIFENMLMDTRVNTDLYYYNSQPTDHKEWDRNIDNNSHIYYSKKSYFLFKKEYYNPDIVNQFLEKHYDIAIISGTMPFTSLHLLIIFILKGIPFIFAADTTSFPLDSNLNQSRL